MSEEIARLTSERDQYAKLLRELLELIDEEPAASHALGSVEHLRKAVGLTYGCALHRSVGVPCMCPAKEEEL